MRENNLRATTSHPSLPYDDEAKKYKTATGLTKHKKYNSKISKAKKISEKLTRRATEKFFPWVFTDAKSKKNTRKEYQSMKKKINLLYEVFLSYGSTSLFNKYTFLTEPVKKSCMKELKKCYNVAKSLKENKSKHMLKINRNIPFISCNDPHFAMNDEMSKHKFTIQEKTIQFEHTMNSIHLNHCKTCLEYKLEFNKENEQKEHDRCTKCVYEKIPDVTHFLNEGVHPVWYERNQDGTLRTTENGNTVPRYDVPPELKELTIAEKLIIRRYCPLIPTVHLKPGTLGLKGHCICFPQDIDELCNTLPQQKCQVLKYVRQIGTNESEEIRWEMLRVNRDRVLRALRWLKLHHSGYKDIIINESHLDWMKGEDEASIISIDSVLKMKSKPDDSIQDEEVCVSENQCKQEGDNEMEIYTVRQNNKVYRPNEKQTGMILDIKESAKKNNHDECLLDFPPIDNLNPVR